MVSAIRTAGSAAASCCTKVVFSCNNVRTLYNRLTACVARVSSDAVYKTHVTTASLSPSVKIKVTICDWMLFIGNSSMICHLHILKIDYRACE